MHLILINTAFEYALKTFCFDVKKITICVITTERGRVVSLTRPQHRFIISHSYPLPRPPPRSTYSRLPLHLYFFLNVLFFLLPKHWSGVEGRLPCLTYNPLAFFPIFHPRLPRPNPPLPPGMENTVGPHQEIPAPCDFTCTTAKHSPSSSLTRVSAPPHPSPCPPSSPDCRQVSAQVLC